MENSQTLQLELDGYQFVLRRLHKELKHSRGGSYGICHHLVDFCFLNIYNMPVLDHYKSMDERFPCVHKYQPEHKTEDAYWWPYNNIGIRIYTLEKCVEEILFKLQELRLQTYPTLEDVREQIKRMDDNSVVSEIHSEKRNLKPEKMITLTIAEKIAAYQHAIDCEKVNAQQDYSSEGICIYLNRYVHSLRGYCELDSDTIFAEFHTTFRNMLNDEGYYWETSDHDSRIKACEEMIRLLQQTQQPQTQESSLTEENKI